MDKLKKTKLHCYYNKMLALISLTIWGKLINSSTKSLCLLSVAFCSIGLNVGEKGHVLFF